MPKNKSPNLPMSAIDHPTTYESMPLIWCESRPNFEICCTDSWKAGNCYHKSTWRVRSVDKLTDEDFKTWIEKLVRPGQGYFVRRQPEPQIAGYYQDDKRAAAGYYPRPFYEYWIDESTDSGD